MGEGKNNTKKKNIIDLIKLGIFMKDSIDLILQKTNVNSVLFRWQCIVLKWTVYFMVLIAPDTLGTFQAEEDSRMINSNNAPAFKEIVRF
uniref:Uncharacterized protein n=1 Tax=Rhizophagus irregularis (strain DAOM 181602 / DAOM 197198 / MUCL 43194) TaxID=747089 RepID=U9TFZ0_RHIID